MGNSVSIRKDTILKKKHKPEVLPPPQVKETFKDYVARVCGTDYYLINPWVDNLAGWTEGMVSSSPFPRNGANDKFHMDTVKGLCLGDKEAWPYYGPDPQWDMEYMNKGGQNWLQYAPYWYDRPEDKTKQPSSKSFLAIDQVNSEKKHQLEKGIKRPSLLKHAMPPPYKPLCTPIYPSLREEDLDFLMATSRPPTAPPVPVLPPPALQAEGDGSRVVEARQVPDVKPKTKSTQEVKTPVVSSSTKSTNLEDDDDGTEWQETVGDREERGGRNTGRNLRSTKKPLPDTTMPFLTVGDQLVKKPMEIEDINKIIKHCPKPNIAPLGTIAYLKRACNGRNYTQEDMKLIIDGILESCGKTAWSWDAVPSIYTVEGANVPATSYKLNTSEGRDAMWTEVQNHMTEVFKPRSSLPIAVACKQKSGESIPEFWKRFTVVWTQEAGLTTVNMHNLFISTFLNNLRPHLITPVKQLITSWTSDSLLDFEKHIYEKEAAGCFDIPNPSSKQPVMSQNYQHRGGKPPNKGQGRGRGTGQIRGPPNQARLPGRCFNCGKEGHWARQCRLPQRPDMERRKGPISNDPADDTRPPARVNPRFPLQWGQNTQA